MVKINHYIKIMSNRTTRFMNMIKLVKSVLFQKSTMKNVLELNKIFLLHSTKDIFFRFFPPNFSKISYLQILKA